MGLESVFHFRAGIGFLEVKSIVNGVLFTIIYRMYPGNLPILPPSVFRHGLS